MVTSSIRQHRHIPALHINDQPMPAITAYIKPDLIQSFRDAGVKLYTSFFNLTWWIGPDLYDFSEFDAQVSEYVESVPEGLLMPRMDFASQGYPWWGEAHPDEMMVLLSIASGEVLDPSQSDPRGEEHLHHEIHLKGLNLHSFHSKLWREEAGKAIAALVSHAEEQPYGDKIWGWHICDGWPQEWFHWGEYNLDGLADYSPAALSEFREWLRATYENDERKLHSAWGRIISFDQVQIPTPAERMHLTHGIFYDPLLDRPTIDYTQCLSDAMVDSIVAVCGTAKRAMRSEKITCVFYGYPFCHLPRPQLIGHNALKKLLASPVVDAIASPHSYDHRGLGGYHAPQAMADTARRAGKIHFDEVDCKTVWTPQVRWKDNINHPTTVPETIEMMKKDAAYQMASASAQWWMDLFNQGWFDAKEASEVICKCRLIEERLFSMERKDFGEIALVVSERSQMFQAPKDGLIDASREMFRNWYLSRIGAPFEQLLMSDLAYPDLPQYKLYIMADSYYLSNADREMIQKVVARNHATVLWIYAPGYLDDHSASLANMEQITGIHFARENKVDELNVSLTNYNHPITNNLPINFSYGTGINRQLYLQPSKIQILPDTRVSPSFYVDDPGAQVLGIVETTGKPGLVVKDLESVRSIYSAAPVYSWHLIQNIARWAGVHLFNEQGDMVWGNNHFLALYSQFEGDHKVVFPYPVDVEDAYEGVNIGQNISQLNLPMKLWETKLLIY